MNYIGIREKLSSFLEKEIVVEAIKYLFVGGICTVLDFFLLFVLKDYFSVNYVIASIISFSASVILNYFLCTLWIFKTRIIKNRYGEFMIYVIISVVGLFINTGLIWLFTEILGTPVLFSKVLGTPIVLIWNFFGRKYLAHTIKINK
jgi:putative flippase GtrA